MPAPDPPDVDEAIEVTLPPRGDGPAPDPAQDPSGADSQAQWETIAAQARTLGGSPHSTIKPRERALGSTGRGVLNAFTESGLVPAAIHTGALELGEVLGEGGMGVVRLATQTVMARQVAVKAVRPALRAPGPTLKLLQEAWTAGRLEHPNIIPIYDIALDDDGSPLIVLKRIEGVAWSALVGDPERTRADFDVGDVLEWHLQVLMQVCNAVHFAHDRKIVHLDLKPENVMIGQHGEVYVVDWGIAMALEDDGTGRVPVAAQCKEIIGTPHYMAPEMLEADGKKLGPWTDVYLLGAMLYELIAGHPPHRGDTLAEVLHAALMDTPRRPAHAPDELWTICCTAMAVDPTQRYASPDTLRRALQAFLRHRESGRLAAQAHERLVELQEVLADLRAEHERQRDLTRSSDARPAPVPRDGTAPQALFAQARFGFEQALASWPDNARAREGLARAIRVMVEHELAWGDPQVAAALVSEFPDVPRALRVQVDAAVAKQRASRQALEKLGREHDPKIGQRTRAFVFGLLGLLWTLMPALDYLGVYHLPFDHLSYAIPPIVSLVVGGALAIWARDSLSRTAVNRNAVATATLSMLAFIALLGGTYMLDVPPDKAMIIMSLVWAVTVGMAALVFDRRLSIAAGAYLLCFFGQAAWPRQMFLVLAIANFVFMLVVLAIWRPESVRFSEEERRQFQARKRSRSR